MTEVIAKIIIPITQIILARLLAPDAFGALATVIMITSFAEMLSDAGFQRYLIQHEFASKDSLYRSATVAFWSSMAVAIGLLIALVTLRDAVAALVGSPGLGIPVAVASLALPMSVFVSTQQALFKRDFEYKKLLPIRVTVAITPLVVSVPLAFAGLDYWALIIGALASNFINAIAMTAISPWKPTLFFSIELLRTMFGFSAWSLLESISIWMSLWAGTFIAGSLLSPHELGLYRQPILVVNSAFGLITNATTPILFAALSRLQSDLPGYRGFFFQFQFAVAIAVLPVGLGAYFFRDFFTNLLFGPQWAEAALMLGVWAASTSFSIVFSHYCSEVYRSLGRPKVSFLSQCLYISVMVPALYFAALDSFTALVIATGLVRFVHIAINQALTYAIAQIGFWRVITNLRAPLLATALMAIVAAWLSAASAGRSAWSSLGVLICSLVYVLACLCFSRVRALARQLIAAVGRHQRST